MTEAVKDFLLEIGTEELPAQYVELAIERYGQIFAKFFAEHGLQYREMETFGTPRRVAFLVRDLPQKQPDRVDEVRGPAYAAAKTATGEWSPAALGFARSQKIAPDELVVRETSAGAYVFAVKEVQGRATSELLAEYLPELLVSADWPKSMRWGAIDLKFLRPIRWLLALYGEEVIPFSLAGVESGNKTFGHRTLAPLAVGITAPAQYETMLEKVYVVANVAKRKAMIVKQVTELAERQGLQVRIDEDLLSEVTELVEYPTAFMGNFNADFLRIPTRVIVTSMKENQRYFPVYDQAGQLAARFIGVRNGGSDYLEQVVKGNEKVLTARLADALFFFAEDTKVPLRAWREKLKAMTYQDQLGSVYDRNLRIVQVADALASAWGLPEETRVQVHKAAELAKFDLATHMVYEFPELEGYMGRIYAALATGEEQVALALEEQYMPKAAGAEIAGSAVGKILALADKLERLVGGVASLGMPTGSQDPYGLRRAAMGIVRTLAEGEVPVSLQEAVNLTVAVMRQDKAVRANFADQVVVDILAFLSARFKNWLVDKGLPGDVADGLVAVRPYAVLEVARIAEGVADQLASGEFSALIEIAKRVRNILQKQERPQLELRLDVFSEPAERVLYEAVTMVQDRAKVALGEHNADLALTSLHALEGPVAAFFEQLMVLAEDEAVRARRLALLGEVQDTLLQIVDLSRMTSL